MPELFQDCADESEHVKLMRGRKGAEPLKKIPLAKGMYDIMTVDTFFPGVLLEGVDECWKKISHQLAKGHSASHACTETDL